MNTRAKFKSRPAHIICQLTAVPSRWMVLILLGFRLLPAGMVLARAGTNSAIIWGGGRARLSFGEVSDRTAQLVDRPAG